MLNWIVWNKTAFCHWNCVLMLNWIVLNGTVFWHLNCVLMLNWIVWNLAVFTFNSVYCPLVWGNTIDRRLLCRTVRSPNECSGYDTKQSDGEVPVMLELYEMQSTPSLSSLPGPLWSGVVAPDRVLPLSIA